MKFFEKLRRSLYKRWSRLLDIIGDIKVFKFPFFMVYDPSFFKMTGEKIQAACEILQPGTSSSADTTVIWTGISSTATIPTAQSTPQKTR